MKPYEPRPAGRHVKQPNGKLVREGEFTDPDAIAAPPAETPEGDKASAADPATPPTGKKGK